MIAGARERLQAEDEGGCINELEGHALSWPPWADAGSALVRALVAPQEAQKASKTPATWAGPVWTAVV